ncbi:MAG: class I SAM-dependent methyltransferase [Deltaproteobacteria bacterium]|jgi:hypothetical protein|nr:class I SAM-dependent methyltransferase [Deltaproteobacteria bacterium]MBW2536773.1 class I SAM-dependent methyltransferase [Deltaproteobacteria bacterium]
MLAFWPDVVRPLLEELDPAHIVEIGSESGKTTKLLLEFAAERQATVHAIDPAPLFDPAAVREAFGAAFAFYPDPSLTALEQIERIDAALIDGDHNWYTVFHELSLIEHRCMASDRPLPLILLHDVAWPYGRRDLYYDPDKIPAEFRQPWDKKGISPTESALLDEGGLNAHLCNALHEGGPKNGVLTAVEDYLAETETPFVTARIPAVFGLGILLPEPLARAKPELRRRVEIWKTPEVERFIDRLEMARIAMLTSPG